MARPDDDRIAAELRAEGFEDVVEVQRGGFGIVYRARRMDFDQVIAIKVLFGNLDEQALSRLDRERRAMGALGSHPSIVTPYGSGSTASGYPYILMEYAPGGSLADRIASAPLPWQEVIDIGSNLAAALEAAHAAGVLHRDVKPDNVLISMYGAPMLADFGIARFADSAHTQTGQVTASIAHAAPEVLDGKPPSAQSDIYSLSSTLYEALSGKGPFARDTDESVYALIARIGREDPPDLREQGVPSALCAVLERGLAKDPQHRFASANDFGNALHDAKAGRAPAKTVPIEVRLQDPEGASPKRPFRRGLLVGIGAFAVAVLIAAAAVLVARTGNGDRQATNRASITTVATTTAPTTSAPPQTDTAPRFATIDCEVALEAVNEFSLSDRLQLQALFQAFIGPAPESEGTALRIVGLPMASQTGDPYEGIWSPETGLSVTGGFFEFELLDDPATFPVIVLLDANNNFVCEPNVPTG